MKVIIQTSAIVLRLSVTDRDCDKVSNEGQSMAILPLMKKLFGLLYSLSSAVTCTRSSEIFLQIMTTDIKTDEYNTASAPQA